MEEQTKPKNEKDMSLEGKFGLMGLVGFLEAMQLGAFADSILRKNYTGAVVCGLFSITTPLVGYYLSKSFAREERKKMLEYDHNQEIKQLEYGHQQYVAGLNDLMTSVLKKWKNKNNSQ